MVSGTTTYSEDNKGLRYAQFDSDYSTPVVEPFEVDAHVQRMRDGSLYMTEKPKKKRSQAKMLWRYKYCSLSLTVQNRIHFTYDRQCEHLSWEDIARDLVNGAYKAVEFMNKQEDLNR